MIQEYILEDFLRHHVEKFPTADGASFFKEKIVPCAKTLKCFRNGELRFETENYSNAASLEFLRKAATTTQGGREEQIEMLILGCLMVSEKIDTETGVIKGREFSSRLFKLEQLTLWMMLVPNRKMRVERCFSILTSQPAHHSGNAPLDLTKDEKQEILDGLHEMRFTDSQDFRTIKLILERLNEFETSANYQVRVETFDGKLQLEHVLPQKYQAEPEWVNRWDKEAADEWMHRLGNLALLNQSANGSISNLPFEDKREIFKGSPYPLTQRISNFQEWNKQNVETNHHRLLGLIKKHWNL